MNRARSGMLLGLDRMMRVVSNLGHPEQTFRSVHIAGSNGKGSTAAFCASLLAVHGLRVGLYTSPHLVSVTERFRIFEGEGHRTVTWEGLERAMTQVEAVEDGTLTFFEAMTAAGFVWFAEEKIDVAVIEAGLGARLDATRVVPAEVAVLTDLSLEHTDVLGDSIAAIAAEEGAVIRTDRPLVCADGPSEAMTVVNALAKQHCAEVFRLGERVKVNMRSPSRFDFDLDGQVVEDVSLALPGLHQGRNAALAGQTARLLVPSITSDSLRRGWSTTRWPGRMEIFDDPRGPSILLDGAQNPHATSALANALTRLPNFCGRLHFVFGVLEDKDADSMLRVLAPLAATWTLTRPRSPRGRAPETLRTLLPAAAEVVVVPSGPRAFFNARSRALSVNEWVIVCGSLYLVGEIRPLLTG